MPINGLVSGVPRVHLPLPVAQPADESSGRLLPEDVGVRQSPPTAGFLDCFRQAAREMAKEPVTIVDDFVDSEG